MRTRPCSSPPATGCTLTRMPGRKRASSAEVTSARHSSRPWRISRNSSVPVPTTAPKVALRAEMMPASGASTVVCWARNSCTFKAARAAATRASAACALAAYWLICCALSAPEPCSVRARSALLTASAALAWASSRLARACATSACTLSLAKTASVCPALTRSPTLTSSCDRRKPLDSAPTSASCQAAILPLAASRIGSCTVCVRATDTVSAGRATTAAGADAAPAGARLALITK